jgi:hypothetical protein
MRVIPRERITILYFPEEPSCGVARRARVSRAGFTARPAREDAGARFSDESFISSGDALKE